MKGKLYMVLLLVVLAVTACGQKRYQTVDLPVVETAEAGVAPEESKSGR